MEAFIVLAMFKRYMAILGVFSSKEKADNYISQVQSLINEEEYGTLAELFDAHLSLEANYNGKSLVQEIANRNMGALQVFDYTVDGNPVSQPKPGENYGYFPKPIPKQPKEKPRKVSLPTRKVKLSHMSSKDNPALYENKTLKDTFDRFERIWKDNKEENE